MNRVARIPAFLRSVALQIMYLPQEGTFHSNDYLRLNSRRLEHLASLGLPLSGQSVLEVGAGIGDHSHFYLDRGCRITITDARNRNLRYLRRRYPGADIQRLDLDNPEPCEGAPFNIIHCFGVLYHLQNPEGALRFMGEQCKNTLILETCVSTDENSSSIRAEKETAINPTQSITGWGMRPSRAWVFNRLKELFEYVYVPRTQPNHEDFPIDWSAQTNFKRLSRAIFIASRTSIDNEKLTTVLVNEQSHEP